MGVLRNNPEMKIAGPVLVCLLAAVFALASCGDGEQTPADAVEWGYTGPGAPENWAYLSEEYTTCADGQQQSPIDITGYEMTDAEPISFLYDSDAAAVRDDGRFVHIDYAPGSMLSVGKQIFELKSAHLHSPSEHWIDGVRFAAELHLVHAGADDRLAAVALLFKLGAPSAAVEAILDAAPAAGSTVSAGITLNASGYAPDELGYYQYDGSKTTPPCQEAVTWLVMREPKTISQEQVNRLLALSDGPNNRPVQPTGSRVVKVGG